MKILSVGLLIFELALLGSQFRYVSASGGAGVRVPKEFSYPEPPSTTKIEQPIIARSLSGSVLAPSGSKIPRALVELVSRDWKTRVDARFTNSEGSFAFAKVPMGKYFLKVSMRGFDTLLVPVITAKKTKARLRLYLKFST
jgi:hypothetical protein